MIQLAALPTTANPATSAIANAPATPAGQPGETMDQLATAPNSADFASFLGAPQAGAQDAIGAGESTTTDAAPAETAAIGARAMLQQLAAALQQGGKSLPGPGKLPAGTAAAQAAVGQTAPESETMDPLTTAVGDPAAVAMIDPLPALLLMSGTEMPASPATPATPSQAASYRSDAAQADTPALGQAALPALVEAQLHGRPLTLAAVSGQTDQIAASTDQAATADTRTITVARNGNAPTQAFTINPGAAPEQPDAVRLRPIVMAKGAAAKSAVIDPALSLTDPSAAGAAMAMPQAIAQSTPGVPVAAAATAGHDFAALVDRLIEARDAASPQGIHVAMDHAEFGKVSLSFRQDAAGLSVSVASPDPDFARAVQAATPSASSDSTDGQTQSDARNSGAQADLRQQFSGTSAQSHGGGPNRSPANEPRENRAADNSTAASAAATPEEARRRGLFA